jgi:aminopeptidase-like protein
MQQMIESLIGLPRDTVSEGFDAALAAIASQLPLRVHQYPTGMEVGSDIVPEKWTCREAFLATEDGQRLFSSTDDTNHVPAYSWPFKGSITRAELLEHLYSGAAESGEVPFVTLLGRRQWGLCCSGRQLGKLHHDRYEVKIDSAFSYGTCKVGENTIVGKSQRSIVLVSRLDRRSEVWRGVAGAVVGIEAMRQLARADVLEYTVRLLLVPGSIGLAAWVDSNAKACSAVSWVVVLDAVSTGNPLRLQGSSALAASAEPKPDNATVTVDSISVVALTDACSTLVGLVTSTAPCTAR